MKDENLDSEKNKLKEKKGAPELRFEGFLDDWEQRKLGEELKLLKDGTHGTHKDVDEGVYLLSAKNIKNGQIIFSEEDRKISLKEFHKIHKNFTLQQNDVLLTVVGSIGESALMTNSINITFQRSVAYLRPKAISSQFLYSLTTSLSFQKELKNRQVISAQPGIYLGDLAKIPIGFPKSKNEQDKIGIFFKQLDNDIALHQRKLDKLKLLKQGYLQQLFPENGKNAPRIRFANFEGEWEEHKLGEVANRFDNLRIPITASDRISGDTPYYGANGIQDYVEGFTHDGEFILVAEDGANDLKNYPVQYVSGRVWVNNHAHVLQGKKSIADNKFLMNAIKNFNIEPFLVGGGRAKLNADVMMKIVIKSPTHIEQQKIGTFFKQLDNIITLHQSKIDKLKSIKQSLLQKMFI